MIDIKFGSLLPWQFRVASVGAIVVAFAILQNYWWVSLLIIAASFFVLVSHEGTEIDTVNKTFRSYTSFFFFKTGEFEKYTEVERIFINSGNQSMKMYSAHTSLSTTIKERVFNAYIKFSNGEKVHLLTSKSKEDVMKKLVPISNLLKMEIVEVVQ
jgi:hypothetical protein